MSPLHALYKFIFITLELTHAELLLFIYWHSDILRYANYDSTTMPIVTTSSWN